MKKVESTGKRIQKKLKNQNKKTRGVGGGGDGQIVQVKEHLSCQEFHVLTYDGGRVWVRDFIGFVTVQGHWWRSTWLRKHTKQGTGSQAHLQRLWGFKLRPYFPFPRDSPRVGKNAAAAQTQDDLSGLTLC